MSQINYQSARFVGSFASAAELPLSTTPEVAFIGRSNTGKSSLLNALFGRHDLVKVSSTPGKTVHINLFEADGIRFVDLPGYGFARVSRAEAARMTACIEDYLAAPRSINLVCALMDIRRDVQDTEKAMLESLAQEQIAYCVVLTKADKLSKSAALARSAGLARAYTIDSEALCVTSAKSGFGISGLKKRIEEACLEPLS